MQIGEIIKLLRKKRGYSQVEFAGMVDLSQTSLSLIENGHTQAQPNTLKTIAEKLQVPLGYLQFLTVSEEDVPVNKREAYKVLGPAIKVLILKLFEDDEPLDLG